MPARIIGVVLDKLAIENDALDFGGSEQPIRARHLLHGMRQKEETLASRSPDLVVISAISTSDAGNHCREANLPEATARGGPFAPLTSDVRGFPRHSVRDPSRGRPGVGPQSVPNLGLDR